VIDPVNAREAIHPVNVPPNPLGIVLMVTLPSVNDCCVPATKDMYRHPKVPVPLTQKPTEVFAGKGNMSVPNGMGAWAALPALVAVVDLNNTHPLAAVMLGVVWPTGRTPPRRYQISTGPEVPKAAEKTFSIPVRKIG
jgi:hypothetical protein